PRRRGRPPGAPTVEPPDARREPATHGALRPGQVRIPDIEDQDRARPVPLVPALVFERVVEAPCPAAPPLARFGAHAKAAALRHDERDMHDESRIGLAGMRRDTGPGIEYREEGIGPMPRYVDLWRP